MLMRSFKGSVNSQEEAFQRRGGSCMDKDNRNNGRLAEVGGIIFPDQIIFLCDNKMDIMNYVYGFGVSAAKLACGE